MATVKLENIKKIYKGNVVAVHDFNLEIKDKEFVVFVGPSGCGKSTTLRMIAGLEEISEGCLKIDDVIVNDMQPKDREISMVFQNYALYPHLSVFENLAFPLRLAKVAYKEPKTEEEKAAIKEQIALVKKDIHTLEEALKDKELNAKCEEEVKTKVSPKQAKIDANKKLASELEEKKECRAYVKEQVAISKELDKKINEIKAKIFSSKVSKEEIASLKKELKKTESAYNKARYNAEHPLSESKTERINDKLNALSYKNVLLEEQIKNIKEKISIKVRLEKFKDELKRLEEDLVSETTKYKKIGADEIYKRVTEAANILGITEYLNRKPRALSGGQRQRVAIGRAMVKNSKVFLMDEPLSNLDAKLRNQMRAEIILLRKKINTTFVYVTHDQTEAMTLGDRIVVMKDGFIMQVGTPEEVFDKPANLFVAEFIGAPKMNTIKCKLSENAGKYSVNPFGVNIALDGAKGKALKAKGVKSQDIVLGVRPEHMKVLFKKNASAIPVTVQVNEMMGSEFHMHVLTKDEQSLIVRVPTVELTEQERANIVPGKEVYLSFEDKVMHFFNAETEESLLK